MFIVEKLVFSLKPQSTLIIATDNADDDDDGNQINTLNNTNSTSSTRKKFYQIF